MGGVPSLSRSHQLPPGTPGEQHHGYGHDPSDDRHGYQDLNEKREGRFPAGRERAGVLLRTSALQLGIPLIVNTSSGIMNTDSGHREHSPERSDGLASQFIPSESRFSLF